MASSYLNIVTFLLTTLLYYLVLKPTLTLNQLASVEQLNEYKTNNNILNTAETPELVFWITPGLRYDADYLNLVDVHPYAQMGIGGSSLGLIAKSEIGIQYQPDYSRFGLTLGYQYSRIWYSVSPENMNIQNLNSNNSGLILGLNFKF